MPAQTTSPHRATIEIIQDMERRRRNASVNEDFETLAALLDDELVFIHSTGYAHNKNEYLAFLSERIKTIDIVRPEPLAYRVLEDMVICTGRLEQQMQRKTDGSFVDIRALVTQIWIKRPSGWKLLQQHSTRTPD